MSNKSVTMQILDTVPIGKKFYSVKLCNTVRVRNNNQVFVSTCLRYLREWNTLQADKKAVCICKSESLYMIVGV